MKSQAQKNFRKLRVFVKRQKDATEQEKTETLNLLGAETNIAKQITLECAPMIEANREAFARMFSHNARNGIENNEELYGRSVRQTRQKYAGDVHNFRSPGTSCDCEVSEVEKGLLVSMGRNEDGTDHNEVKIS